MTPADDAPSPGEMSRWMQAIEKRMEAGFLEVRADVAEVRGKVDNLSFVRSDVYASDQRSRDLQLAAMEKAAAETTTAQNHRINVVWTVVWALLFAVIAALIGIVARIAGTLG